MTVITSVSNPRIKETMKLRESKHRHRAGKFLIDGFRELQCALRSGIRVIEYFTVHPFISDDGVLVHTVSDSVMKKISFGDRDEGIIAVAEEPVRSFDVFVATIGEKVNPLLAVLEGVEKPGNLGAVFRSADAAGLDGVMIADSRVDPFHANSIRSSMGTVFSMPMVFGSSSFILRWLQDRKIQIAASWCHGHRSYTSVDFCRPSAIVLGSESEGLTKIWQGDGITSISIPMHGIADSLNVSVAASVLFYEARRKRS